MMNNDEITQELEKIRKSGLQGNLLAA